MSVYDDFLDAARGDGRPGSGDPVLLPTRVTVALTQVLGVGGAGLSTTDVLRVPLGSSGPRAARAEGIQVTLGEGPCLAARDADGPVVCTEARMAARWPVFLQLLASQTGFRSAASVPVKMAGAGFGAIDLYCDGPEEAAALDLTVAAELAMHIGEMLAQAPPAVIKPGIAGPAWLATDSARRRMAVWQAVGLIAVALRSDSHDALAALRAAAYSRDTDIDDLAEDLIARRLHPDSL